MNLTSKQLVTTLNPSCQLGIFFRSVIRWGYQRAYLQGSSSMSSGGAVVAMVTPTEVCGFHVETHSPSLNAVSSQGLGEAPGAH